MVPGAIIVLCLGAAGLLAAGAPDPATSPSEEVTERVCRYVEPKQSVREPRPSGRPPTVREQRERTRVERHVHLLQRYAKRFPETFGGLSIEDRVAAVATFALITGVAGAPPGLTEPATVRRGSASPRPPTRDACTP